MRILVVGAGAMGRWVGTVLRSAATPVDLTVADADSAVARDAAAALDAGIVEAPLEASADLVCIAVPIPAATSAIATWAPAAETAIADVTGTAKAPIAAMREHAPDCERVSLHPLFAPENEPGNVAAVIDADGPLVTTFIDAITARGNDLYETTAVEHDDAMSTVQARTHAAILAFGLAAKPVPEPLHTPVSAALSDLVDQVTDGDPRVYADIQDAFPGATDVADAARRVAEADTADFERLYADASEE